MQAGFHYDEYERTGSDMVNVKRALVTTFILPLNYKTHAKFDSLNSINYILLLKSFQYIVFFSNKSNFIITFLRRNYKTFSILLSFFKNFYCLYFHLNNSNESFLDHYFTINYYNCYLQR